MAYSDLAQSLNCHCAEYQCLGPNVLVKNMYYPNTDFKENEKQCMLSVFSLKVFIV